MSTNAARKCRECRVEMPRDCFECPNCGQSVFDDLAVFCPWHEFYDKLPFEPLYYRCRADGREGKCEEGSCAVWYFLKKLHK